MKIFDLICARWECEMGMRDVMCICVYRSMSMCAYMYIDCGIFSYMYMRDRSFSISNVAQTAVHQAVQPVSRKRHAHTLGDLQVVVLLSRLRWLDQTYTADG